MDKLTVNILNDKIEMIIRVFKLLIGNNEVKKYQILQAIKGYFNKSIKSESGVALLWNENPIDLKTWRLFEVTSQYELSNDLKLGTKSLILKYYESVFTDIERNEEIMTINILLNSFNDDYICPLGKFGEFELLNEILPINYKSLTKMLSLNLYKNSSISNEYDMDYNELLSFQINLIKEISNRNNHIQFLVVIEAPVFSKIIMNCITESNKNIHYLIISSSMDKNESLKSEDILFCGDGILDLSNEEQLYNLSLNLNKNYNIDEIKSILYDYLLRTKQTDKINYILN
jgi:hypothetical protein